MWPGICVAACLLRLLLAECSRPCSVTPAETSRPEVHTCTQICHLSPSDPAPSSNLSAGPAVRTVHCSGLPLRAVAPYNRQARLLHSGTGVFAAEQAREDRGQAARSSQGRGSGTTPAGPPAPLGPHAGQERWAQLHCSYGGDTRRVQDHHRRCLEMQASRHTLELC